MFWHSASGACADEQVRESMFSIFGFGAGAAATGGSAIATTGVVVSAFAAGAVAAAVITAGATQVAENVTQPDETAANVNNVSQPNYADE
jgi:hypothetical protein